MANLDKKNSLECNGYNARRVFILPRYFKSTLLTHAFEEIRGRLYDTIFKSVLMENHKLICYEAPKLLTWTATPKG